MNRQSKIPPGAMGAELQRSGCAGVPLPAGRGSGSGGGAAFGGRWRRRVRANHTPARHPSRASEPRPSGSGTPAHHQGPAAARTSPSPRERRSGEPHPGAPSLARLGFGREALPPCRTSHLAPQHSSAPPRGQRGRSPATSPFLFPLSSFLFPLRTIPPCLPPRLLATTSPAARRSSMSRSSAK